MVCKNSEHCTYYSFHGDKSCSRQHHLLVVPLSPRLLDFSPFKLIFNSPSHHRLGLFHFQIPASTPTRFSPHNLDSKSREVEDRDAWCMGLKLRVSKGGRTFFQHRDRYKAHLHAIERLTAYENNLHRKLGELPTRPADKGSNEPDRSRGLSVATGHKAAPMKKRLE